MRKITKAKTTSLGIMLVTAFLLSALTGVRFVAKATATGYTEEVGTLDDANFVARFPDNWNGILIVLCRGYSITPVSDAKTIYNSTTFTLLDQGYAVAASTYGANTYGVNGYCAKKGVNATYQLTKYLVDKYNITGKVFLIGYSMGGNIALLLGEKYPDVYSGVLDMYGGKDPAARYTTFMKWANMSDAELTAELNALNSTVPPYMFPDLAMLRYFYSIAATAIVTETGGTPANASKAYEDLSPVCHANISIPEITVHGTSDAVILYNDSLNYQTAVANAGRSNLYRLYPVVGGQHADPNVDAELPTRLAELVEWSNTIPEGLSVEVLMLLSALAVAVSARYFRKQTK
jgi:pimeloyl-ACP methyl ester carboxylesterase